MLAPTLLGLAIFFVFPLLASVVFSFTRYDLLSDREREVLRLRFAEDLTQSEIGARVGVSQMHVSRLIRQAIGRLRAAAEDERGAA